MKDSIKKSLAVAVISAFLSNAHGACAQNKIKKPQEEQNESVGQNVTHGACAQNQVEKPQEEQNENVSQKSISKPDEKNANQKSKSKKVLAVAGGSVLAGTCGICILTPALMNLRESIQNYYKIDEAREKIRKYDKELTGINNDFQKRKKILDDMMKLEYICDSIVDTQIESLKLVYVGFKELIDISYNKNLEEFKQNLKYYVMTFDDNSFELLDYDLLKEVLFAIYQVCANAKNLNNEQIINYLKKLSEVKFEMSDDMNALVITSIKNSKKIFLVNNRDFVSAMSTDNKIKSRSDSLFNDWKNNKDDGKFVDEMGKLIKNFWVTSFQNNLTDQDKLIFSLIPGHPGFK